MFALSVNVLHPLITRYGFLWRWSQVVSDWIVFILSFLCCQCVYYLPCAVPLDAVENNSTPSFEAYQIISSKASKEKASTSKEALKNQHRYLEEQKINDQNSRKFLKKHPELEGMKLERDHIPVLRDSPEPERKETGRDYGTDYPAIHKSNK